MKLNFLTVFALLATAVFAQGPRSFGSRPPYNDRTQGDPNGPVRSGQNVEHRGWGDRRGRMSMGPRELNLGRLLSDPNIRTQLGVNAEQAAKIRQQESDFHKAEIRNSAELQIKRLELNDLLSAEKPDHAAIDSKLQEVGAAQIATEKAAIDFRLGMRDALTPAQRQKLRQIMAQRQAVVVNPEPGNRGPQGRGGRGNPQPPPQARPNQ